MRVYRTTNKTLFTTNSKGARERMENAHGFRKFLKAKEYEEVAKHLFIIVETASRRVADQNLMAQISEAISGRGPGRGTPPPPPGPPPPSLPLAIGTTSTLSNPFSDSHEEPSAADVDVGNLNQVEMSIFESGATGGQFMISVVVLVTSLIISPEAAIVLELHGRDGTTQEVAATIPLAIVSDDEMGEKLPRVKLVCG
ncbi:hypothetical protein EDB83DRAFT_1126578 [Lactarius deliciosus]|nr:hypothetical protein EDB83DRAFT_1126578 [Lactarius deliciosus]